MNAAGVKLMISVFLCPSDHGQRVNQAFGPTNYAACTGAARTAALRSTPTACFSSIRGPE